MDSAPEELLIVAIARLLEGARHVAVGMASPIPGSAALLAKARAGGDICAGQGRIDAFFLGGGQIDGQANINLVGVGEYPHQKVRWAGSFGSAYLYFVVPRVILFREEHTRRVLVPKVDFISAPGTSAPNVYRPGGPHALVTSLCLFSFDKIRRRFRLESVHPGHSIEEVRDNTGFDFDMPEHVPETPAPHPATLALVRDQVASEIADAYPRFAKRVFGIGHEAQPAI
jgi:glutaconate CoA-transferase subunit B